MPVYRITGQGTYGPLRPPYRRGPMSFWSRHHSGPPAQNTIIVYQSGLVIEGNNFGQDVLTDPSIYRVLTGGYRHTVDSDADPFLYDCLDVAGYSFHLET